MSDGNENAGGGGASPATPSTLVVMGVTGSGKTTVGSLLANRIGWEYEDADWFHPPENIAKMKSGKPLTDEDRWPWLHAIARWIGDNHTEGRHGVVACSGLKRVYRDILAGDLGEAVRFIYLEGSRAVIGERLSMRHNHFMPPSLLDSQFATLEVPGADENVLTVSVEAHPREIVDEIIARLALPRASRGGAGRT